MAGNDQIGPEIVVQGADEAIAALKHIGEVGADAFSKIIDAASHGDFTGLATLVGGELAGSFAKAAESVLEFVKGQAEAVETMGNFASATNMSLGQFQGLGQAFASAGISAGGFEMTMARMQMRVTQAWEGIQEAARTAGTEEQKAQLGVKDAAMATQQAYINLRKTMDDVASQAINDQDHINSAQTGLERAQLSQQKLLGQNAQGFAISPEAQQAQEHLLQVEEAQNSVLRAQHELEQANTKAAEDAAEATLKQQRAQQELEKAKVAEAEAAEHAYEVELKNIPKISAEIKSVAEGTSQWKDHMDLAAVSAENLARGVIAAASVGGKRPEVIDVMKELSALVSQTGDKAMSTAEKMEIVQRVMGSGFRAGQASAAQLLSILEKGPAVLDAFMKKGEEFNEKSGIGISKADEETMKDFNAAWAELSIRVQQVAGNIAAFVASGLTSWLKAAKESIESNDGALHQLVESFKNAVGIVGQIVKAIGDLVSTASKLSGIHFDTILLGWELALGAVAIALGAVVKAVGLLLEAIGLIKGSENAFSKLGEAASQAGDSIGAAGRQAVGHALGPLGQAMQGHQDQNQQGEKPSGQQTSEDLSAAAQTQQQAGQTQMDAAQSLKQAAEAQLHAAAAPASNSAPEGRAAGGLIHGPGGPTDDRAGMFRLSHGEYVMRNAAVEHYGAPLFDALNNLAVGGFAMGGLVGSGIRVAAPNASQGPSSILNLTIDGNRFNGLRAPADVAGRLKSYAVGRQSASAGRTPSWMR